MASYQLPPQLQQRLKELYKEAARKEKTARKDRDFKKRLALVFKELISLAEKGKLEKKDAAYIMVNFIYVNFEDELDDIISLAGDLEVGPGPIIPASSYPAEWQRLKEMVDIYLNKMEIIDTIKSLNLPQGEFVVFGSAPLAMHGLREVKDIDLLVSPRLYEELKTRGWKEKVWPSGEKYLAFQNVEATQNWNFGEYNPSLEELLGSCEEYEGIPFVNLEEVRKWKKAFGREKDKKDIKLIEEYLSDFSE